MFHTILTMAFNNNSLTTLIFRNNCLQQIQQILVNLLSYAAQTAKKIIFPARYLLLMFFLDKILQCIRLYFKIFLQNQILKHSLLNHNKMINADLIISKIIYLLQLKLQIHPAITATMYPQNLLN